MSNEIERLIELIQPQIPITVDLWDARTVAAYLKVSPRQVTERYAMLDGFPPAIRLPSQNGRGHPRWKAMDIIAWAEKHMETAA